MRHLQTKDPAIFASIQKEALRQEEGLEMIASENYASLAVMEAQGSLLTNKYAEGYPGKRYYGGCEFVDEVETLAIERACKLYDCAFANVQPHSGSNANLAVFLALLKPGDRVLGMNLSHGGHLTHGSPVNISGAWFEAHHYGVDPETELLNYDQMEAMAYELRPKLIIAGYSSYPRWVDWARFRQVADAVGAYLLVDMAHIAGIVAAKHCESPLPHAHVVTTTTHKTLRGPRGGMILSQSEELGKALNSKVFPGLQGGPLEHVIAAKAVAFHEALQPEFVTYIDQVLKNAKALAAGLKDQGLRLVTGGTENHMVVVDLSDEPLTGKEAQELLGQAGITVNKNTVPREKRSPFVTSGVRLGTPALTTRGMGEKEMLQIATWIGELIRSPNRETKAKAIHEQVKALCQRFPIY
jgi:glycine hydroxymethyltransferase